MDSQMVSITVGAKGYPFLLQNTFDPPKCLYYKGTLPKEGVALLAVVGSRKMSAYGKAALEKLLPPIVRAGVGIVSGLAYGIDTEAIRITLEHGGYACGVIGSGMDDTSFYPKQNIALAKRMVLNNGCLLSEYKDGTPALPRHFALRNRIIAGMCYGTLVIEAAKKSGSLITAEVAMNEGRDVFSPPNSIFHTGSSGTNTLIKNGAHLVTESADILLTLGIDEEHALPIAPRQNDHEMVYFLTDEPMHIDVITKKLNLTAQKTSAILSELEIQGVIKNIGGNNYIRNNG